MRCLDGIINLVDMSLSKLQEIVKDREACVLQSMVSQRVGHNIVTEYQQLGVRHGYMNSYGFNIQDFH